MNKAKAAGDSKGFLIDGFPRNQDNLDGWEKQMGNKVCIFCDFYGFIYR